MRFSHKIIIYLFLLLSAPPAFASVVINEVAWMGGVSSASHEWIELYNDGNTSVSVDGWVLGDGVNLSIELSGSIPASGYVVLERTSDETASSPAFLVYTGALVNTGATLTLRNASGEVMDQVAGGENWENIGGNNETKDTAQYTVSGWVTDKPTPGKKNLNGTTATVLPKETEEISVKTSTKSSAKSTQKDSAKNKETVRLVVPNTVLKLTPDVQTTAYVNQTIPFTVTGSGISEQIIKSLKYNWNFGDTYVANGRNVNHSYSYPGTYVVTVRGAYARHDQVARHEITILPVTFSLTRNATGDVQINNDSPYDVDISGYVVKGIKSVEFPQRTIILPKSTITISKDRLGGSEDSLLAIYDTKHNIVGSTYESINNRFLAGNLESDIYSGAGETESVGIASRAVVDNKKLAPVTAPLVSVGYTATHQPEVVGKSAKFTFATMTESVTTANEEFLSVATVSTNTIAVAPTTNLVTEGEEFKAENEVKAETGNLARSDQEQSNWPYLVFIIFLVIVISGLFWGRRV